MIQDWKLPQILVLASLLIFALFTSFLLAKNDSDSVPDSDNCLVRDEELVGDPDYLLAIVMLDQNGENLEDDLALTLILPSGAQIPIVAELGFFRIDLQGSAEPDEQLVLGMRKQELGEGESHTYLPSMLNLRLRDAHNAIWNVNLEKPKAVEIVTCEYTENDARRDAQLREMRRRAVFEGDPPPVFKGKTDEEKKEARVARSEKKVVRKLETR